MPEEEDARRDKALSNLVEVKEMKDKTLKRVRETEKEDLYMEELDA
jgi:hypothetical protein